MENVENIKQHPNLKFGNKQKQTIEVYRKKNGNITLTSEAMNIDRKTFYNWMEMLPEFKEAIEDIDESLLDFTESQLHSLIKGSPYYYKETKDIWDEEKHEKVTLEHIIQKQNPPDNAAVFFHLKTKGKSRGYIEKYNISGDFSNTNMNITIPDNEDELQKFQDYLIKIQKLRTNETG